MTLAILFEDNHLLCLNKPAGIPTQPPPEGGESLESIAKEFIKNRDCKPGNVYLHAVHRLDKPTSGIVIFAKTAKALSRMQKALREKEIKKSYYAIIEGTLTKKEDTLEFFLAHDEHKSVVTHSDKAKKSQLAYRVLQEKDTTSLIEVDLVTGRYHQIRVTFAHIGHPIVGDKKYGARLCFVNSAIALHHFKIEFLHPVHKGTIVLEAPCPDLWKFANIR